MKNDFEWLEEFQEEFLYEPDDGNSSDEGDTGDQEQSGGGEDSSDDGESGGGEENSLSTGKEKQPKQKQSAPEKAKQVKDAIDTGKKIGKLSKMLGPLMPVLGYIALIIAILIAAIGLLMFLLTMPGAILDKIKQLAADFGNAIVNAFFGEAQNVKQSQIAEVATRLEDMGYDLYAYGFESDLIKDESHNDFWGTRVYHTKYLRNELAIKDLLDPDLEPDKDSLRVTSDGILRDKNGIVLIDSDYIRSYLVSDNYVYIIRNNDANFLRTLFASNNRDGLINLYHEGGSLGTLGSSYGTFDSVGGFLRALFGGSRISISVDRSAKQLVVSTEVKGFWGVKRKFLYNLDGWTGRYGMPLEFLLSLHLSSMQPDLCYDLVTKTNTEIQLVTHESKATVKGGVKIDDGSILDSDELAKKKKEEVDALIKERDDKRGYTDLGYIFSITLVGTEEGDRITAEYEEKLAEVRAKYDAYIKKAKLLNTKFDTAIPYIYAVRDHWFRDVYFTNNEYKSFLTLDEEYGKRVGERWTQYETVSADEAGLDTSDVEQVIDYDEYAAERSEYTRGGLGDVRYVLYYYKGGDINNEVKYMFNGKPGTREDSINDDSLTQDEKNTLHKKAIKETLQYVYFEDYDEESDSDKKLTGVNDGRWVAYKEIKNQDSGWQKYEPDNSGETADNISEEEAENLYYKIILSSAIEQIEDGQRGATNLRAKKIFSINKYYTYNGTKDRAEAIDKDRYGSKVKSAYLSYKEGNDGSFNTASDPRNPDLIETFSVTRDSISAFNILTNMNTLDSDAIYHDFKELIVELDFFDKEELANVPSQTFEWLIAERGSSGWPYREYDKMENEFGTLIHSEKQYEFLRSKKQVEMLQKAIGLTDDLSEEGVDSGDDEDNSAVGFLDYNVPINGVAGIATNFLAGTGGAGASNDIERRSEKGDGYDYKVIVDGVEYTHYYQFKGSYAEKTFHGSGGEKTIHNAGCGPTSTVNIATGYNPEVNPTANIVGYSHNQTIGACAKMFEEMTGVHASTEFSESEYATKIHEAFAEGKPCIVLVRAAKGGDTFWTKGGHFVALAGEDSSGNLITLDPGSSRSERHTYPLGVEGIVRYSVALMIPDEPPSGAKKKEKVEDFKGYKPGDYVVSPVTGIVIETGKTNKVRASYNYETGKAETVDYIKMRVLDEQDFKKIFGASSKDNPAKDDEDNEGFKYFLEEYSDAKVTGNIVYIEGFNLELLSDKDTINYSSENCFGNSDKAKNLYTPVTYENVFNKNIQKALKEKEKLKVSALAVQDTAAGILIKEGTVLGTCYDDGEDIDDAIKELKQEINSLKSKGGSTGSVTSSSSSEEEEDDRDRVITMRPGIDGTDGSEKLSKDDIKKNGNGNYIRIIMRASKDAKDQKADKDSIIEDVEDYLEIQAKLKKPDIDWEFFYYVPYESGPVGEAGKAYSPPKGAGANEVAPWNANEVNCGISQWTTLRGGGCNNIPGLCEYLASEDSGLCGSLQQFVGWSPSQMVDNFSQFSSAFESVYNSDPDRLLELEMQYMYEKEYKGWVEGKLDWLLQRPMVVQGTYASCMNYSTNPDKWNKLINDSMTDEQIIDALMAEAAATPSTAGSLYPRFGVAQPKCAKAILNGELTDVETWVRTGQPSEYDVGG